MRSRELRLEFHVSRANMSGPLQKIIANRYGGRNLPVTLVLPDGGRVPLSSDAEIEILARTWRGLKALAAPAMGALARAYVHNDIDFTGSARRAAAIAERMVGEISHGRDSLTTRWRLWRHQQRSNRANIGYHYDVSNAFYRLWLDSQLVYSCAYFRSEGDTLDDAQAGKLDHICRKLRLGPGDRFLDIGCGWGALLFRAAQQHGVQATGITLSQNQFEYVSAEIAARGLAGRVRVELHDYLDLPDDTLYDKIASVGMFEHVGIARFPQYFGKIRRILKPGGLVLNHGITHNPLGADSLGSGIGEFVDEYVFPGGELMHVTTVVEEMSRQGLEVWDAECLRPHYAKTLWSWVDRLEARRDEARVMVGEKRLRTWLTYMAGSAHAFARGWISIYQLLGIKMQPDGSASYPATRAHVYQT